MEKHPIILNETSFISSILSYGQTMFISMFIMLSYPNVFMVKHIKTPMKNGDGSKEKAKPVETQKGPQIEM